LNAIAATTNIVAMTTAGFTNLLAERVEHAVAYFWFEERCNEPKARNSESNEVGLIGRESNQCAYSRNACSQGKKKQR
jgi:hypothetical protein